jgi:hypothetical protein
MLSVAYKPFMLSFVMLSVTYKPLMRSVIMLKVVILSSVMISVVVPGQEPTQEEPILVSPLFAKLLALLASIRQEWKGLSGTNTLVYYENS